MYFEYGQEEIEYLKSRDRRLGEAIDRIGHIYRETDGDLFSSVVSNIVGQQISGAALVTVLGRLSGKLGVISVDTVNACSAEELQSCGMSHRKAEYIKSFAEQVKSGDFDIDVLAALPDKEVIDRLTGLKGIGVWTAEMLLIFCLQRPDVVSFGDFGIRRGMRMLYRHREIGKEKFERYAKRYSPYGSIASLYLWAIAGGAIPEWTDPAVKSKRRK